MLVSLKVWIPRFVRISCVVLIVHKSRGPIHITCSLLSSWIDLQVPTPASSAFCPADAVETTAAATTTLFLEFILHYLACYFLRGLFACRRRALLVDERTEGIIIHANI